MGADEKVWNFIELVARGNTEMVELEKLASNLIEEKYESAQTIEINWKSSIPVDLQVAGVRHAVNEKATPEDWNRIDATTGMPMAENESLLEKQQQRNDVISARRDMHDKLD